MTEHQLSYVLVSSEFGVVGIVWHQAAVGPEVYQILLPQAEDAAERAVRERYPAAEPRSCQPVLQLGHRIRRFLAGEEIGFDLDLLALDRCSPFQRRVLLAEYGIPRGWVSTYGRIAAHLGVPGGARAVGGALARNPFPLVIPCHRAVRSDGHLGGFQGGLEMKAALLRLEGVALSASGKVRGGRFYY
jgi:methylated-DNA-[protein]-cysteine S-methyltransferase